MNLLPEWALVSLWHEQLLQRLHLLQDDPCSTHYAGEWVIGDANWHVCLSGESNLNPEQERTTAGENDPLIHDVCHQLWRRLFNRVAHRIHDLNE
jgi:hypothetical protein